MDKARVYLFFNVFTVPGVNGQGFGHTRVSPPARKPLTHDVVLGVEKQVKRNQGYTMFVVTNIVQIDA